MPVWPESAKDVFFRLQKKVSHKRHYQYQQQMINAHWHNWLEPVVAEHEAVRQWYLMVDHMIEQSLIEYQRDYLNHPHYYDTFQNALIELLKLLEIPGISKILTKTRRILTWPIRKIMRLGQSSSQTNNQEQLILDQIGEHFFISFAEQLLEKIDSDSKQHKWWKDCYCLLRDQKRVFLTDYQQGVEKYSVSFQQDVEQTANRLYNKLSEQPLLLNSLRATRVTTDAAAMALVIQTGGIGVHDLVITPAMLSLTSLLTESALGSYMGNLEVELKQHQLQTVKNDLFISCLQKSLYEIPQRLSDRNRFNISLEQLTNAESQRDEKKHGIRVL